MTVPDVSHVYGELKDFQLATVEHAAPHLFEGGGRFLVADEVGLGKTLVARGLIARALEHHDRTGTRRIDIVYICSNGDIARQNIRRLNVLPDQEFAHATRLTLLPRELRNLERQRINFVSFTPGTSFNLRSTEGQRSERGLLHNMLRRLWGDQVAWGATSIKVFAGEAGWKRFHTREINNPVNQDFDRTLLDGFGRQMEQADGGVAAFQAEYMALHAAYRPVRVRHSKANTSELRRQRGQFVGRLRETLARACVDALEPDLVILDEFQRFKHLFDPEDPAGALARALFDWPDVAVLLLSATPYKMYTRGGEEADDHYADFLHTVKFLLRDNAAELASLTSDIGLFRRAMFDTEPGALDRAVQARGGIERVLRRVMSRTERLAATPERSGMLTEPRPLALSLNADDVRRYVTLDQVGQRIRSRGASTYWESTSYPLTFMDGYVFSRDFEAAVERDGGTGLTDLPLERVSLDFDQVRKYQQVDPGNARMRSLEADMVDRGLWQLLWIPPALQYHTLAGPYASPDLRDATKRLVFSSWTVVPKAIAAHISYEFERRMMTSRGPADNSPEARERIKPLLNFTRSHGRLTGMPVLALLYPSPTLAHEGDPLQLAREHGAVDRPMTLASMMDVTRDRVSDVLATLPSGDRTTDREDQRWYWAAPILLDHQANPTATEAWLTDRQVEVQIREGLTARPSPEHTNLQAHLDEAMSLLRGELELGRRPVDLEEVLAELAVAGPATSVLRGLRRPRSELDRWHLALRTAAASVAFGVRSLFNAPEVTTMLRSEASGHTREDAYWRLVLRHCLEGGLQAVVDEWIHVLVDARAVGSRGDDEYLQDLSGVMRDALMVQTVNYGVRQVVRENGRLQIDREKMRGNMALRFGDATAETDTSMQRAANVRVAFNSPFRPFVLATTSVGQEGLDFHTYCHAVVHWNLPSNPVDLEQREGRVHRYKGHAVRRNVATRNRVAAMRTDGDPWAAMFDAAAAHRQEGDDELVPFWVYPGEAKIERHVPALPLSRESQRLEELRRSAAAYRLVFGQPRQDDLISFLQGRDAYVDLDLFRIDLRPASMSAHDGPGGRRD